MDPSFHGELFFKDPPDQFVNSPFLPTFVLQLAITTAALAFPIALLRQRRRAASSIVGGGGHPSSLFTSTSNINSAPPVRRRAPRAPPHRGGAGPSAIPPSSRMIDDASAKTEPSAKVGGLLRAHSGDASSHLLRVEENSGFNGALYSLKAFGIATALVVAGGAASVWGVKTYLGVRDVSVCMCLFRYMLSFRLFVCPCIDARVCICHATDNAR